MRLNRPCLTRQLADRQTGNFIWRRQLKAKVHFTTRRSLSGFPGGLFQTCRHGSGRNDAFVVISAQALPVAGRGNDSFSSLFLRDQPARAEAQHQQQHDAHGQEAHVGRACEQVLFERAAIGHAAGDQLH